MLSVLYAPAIVFIFALMLAAGGAQPRLFLSRSFLFQRLSDMEREREKKKKSCNTPV